MDRAVIIKTIQLLWRAAKSYYTIISYLWYIETSKLQLQVADITGYYRHNLAFPTTDVVAMKIKVTRKPQGNLASAKADATSPPVLATVFVQGFCSQVALLYIIRYDALITCHWTLYFLLQF